MDEESYKIISPLFQSIKVYNQSINISQKLPSPAKRQPQAKVSVFHNCTDSRPVHYGQYVSESTSTPGHRVTPVDTIYRPPVDIV